MDSREKNKRMATKLGVVVVGMVALSYVSVPLYSLFCKVTGLGGKAEMSSLKPDAILDRTITVRFNTDVAPELPWRFKAPEEAVTMHVGEAKLVRYTATNESARLTQGVAVFNVQPERAGLYFNKVQCFCFQDQPLPGGKSAELPVQFFIDPAIAKDPLMDDVKTITLSYTFFAAKSDKLAAAQKKFDDEQSRAIEAAKTMP
jgi:cytochrome c oxidase assembly protein subunit 11